MKELTLAAKTLSVAIIDQLNVGIIVVDRDYNICSWNRFMVMNSGRHTNDVLGQNLFACFPELPKEWLERKISNVFHLGNFSFTNWEQRPYLFKFEHARPISGGADFMLQDSYFIPVKTDGGDITHVCISIIDVTEIGMYQSRLSKTNDSQKRLIQQLEEAHNQLQQSEKMAAIGQLAAGVAHEINNPVAFVTSNMRTLQEYMKNLLTVVACYEDIEKSSPPGSAEQTRIAAAKQQADYDFLKEDIVNMLNESNDGLERVRRIVQDLKDFSRPDSGEWNLANLHEGIDATLNVVRNEIKYKAEIQKEYGQLPLVHCNLAQLNQVFMNLIVNAAQAIKEHGTITIKTGTKNDRAWVAIRDSGCGIPAENLKRVFDPFYTTKPVGKGTGLGLSVSYGIVQKHHGTIEVASELDKGTEFTVWLPLKQTGESAAQ